MVLAELIRVIYMHVVSRSTVDDRGWQVVLMRNSAREYQTALFQTEDRTYHGRDTFDNAEAAIAAYVERCGSNGVEA